MLTAQLTQYGVIHCSNTYSMFPWTVCPNTFESVLFKLQLICTFDVLLQLVFGENFLHKSQRKFKNLKTRITCI